MTDTVQRSLAAGGMTPDVAHSAPSDVLTPADRYQQLFVDVQTQRIFPDSKTFVDCVPTLAPDEILRRYRDDVAKPGFDLARFVSSYFTLERPPASHYVSDPGQGLVDHIDGLWDVLTRLAICGAGRTLPRALLLGLVFHDAWPGLQRPPRFAGEHGR